MIALLLAVVAIQDEADNPEYRYWSSFKPGAWVRLKQVTEGGGNRRESETLFRLAEAGPRQAVLDMIVKTDGPSAPRRMVLPARKSKSEIWQLGAKNLVQRTETIEVAGKKFECRFEEWKKEDGTIRTWTSPQIPGGIVRTLMLPTGVPEGTFFENVLVEWGLEAPGVAGRLPAGFKLDPRTMADYFDAASGLFACLVSADGKQRLVVDGSEGPAFQQVGNPVFCSSGRRVAYLGTDAASQTIVVDGKPGKPFPRSFSIQSGVGQIVFSADGSKIAWVAPFKGNVAVHVDGTPGKEYYSVRELRFTPDGTPTYLASAPQAPLQHFRVVGEKESPPASPESFPGPDGKRVAELVRTGRTTALKVDGKKGEDFEAVSKITWSSDGSRLAYVGSNFSKSESFVVLDGKKSEAWSGMSEILTFSPDGKRLAYAASDPKTREWFLVLDQKRGPKCTPFNGPVVFSPDGRRLAYPQSGAGGGCIVVDGKKGPDSSQLGLPRFSPDGKHVAYWGVWSMRDRTTNSLVAEKRVMLLDGKPQGEHDAVSEPAFTSDGKELRYFAILGEEIFLRKISLR